MTLKQKIEGIKVLVAKLDEGCEGKRIFEDFPLDMVYREDSDDLFILNPGWVTVVLLLVEMLGLTNIRQSRTSSDYVSELFSRCEMGKCTEGDIYTLRERAWNFIDLMEK